MDLVIKKSLITAQDIEVGIGSVEQVRGEDTLTLSKLNASSLLGIMCFDTLDELKATNIGDITTTVVYVTANKAIYQYDGLEWVKANLNVQIINSYSDIINLPSDSLVAYSLGEQLIYYKVNNTWQATGSNLCVVQKEADLYSLPTGVLAAFVIDTNMIYTYKLGTWSTQISTQNSSPILIVDTIADLPKLSTITTCIVSDRNTGGIFTYDDTLPEVGGDGGVTVGKWRRVHLGLVNVLWFGIDNQGNVDCSTQLALACKHQNILVPPGEYLIKSPVEIENDITLQCVGANFKLEEVGSLVFKGIKSTEASINDIPAGATSYQLNNTNLFKASKYCYLKGTGSLSEYSTIPPAQYLKMVSLTGATVALSGVIQTSLVNPTVSIYDGLSVKVNGLTIISSSSVEAISIENVTDSVFNNINIQSSLSNGIAIKNSTGINMTNVVIFTNADSTTDAILVKDSANIVLDSAIITSGNSAIKYEGLVMVTGIYKSVLTAKNPLYTGDSAISLNVRDSQLSGVNKVGGINMLFDNCVIVGDFFEFYKLSGGSIIFKDCSFTGTSTNLSDVFMHVGSNKVLGDNYKLIKSCNYTLTNNTFTGANVYQGFIEVIGRQAKLNYPGTELSSSVVIDGLYTSLTQPPISAFGRFFKVILKNIVHKAQQLIDIQSIYTANNRSIKTLATNIVQLDSFVIEDTFSESVQLKANIDTTMAAPTPVIGYTLPVGIFDMFYTDSKTTKVDNGNSIVLKAPTLTTTVVYKIMKGAIPIRYPM